MALLPSEQSRHYPKSGDLERPLQSLLGGAARWVAVWERVSVYGALLPVLLTGRAGEALVVDKAARAVAPGRSLGLHSATWAELEISTVQVQGSGAK